MLRFLLFRAWVFPERRESTVVASHQPAPAPSSPTGSPQYPTRQPSCAPLPQRPTAPQYAYDTQIRAGEAADQTWRDATMQLQPVRPSDNTPGDPR